MKANELQIKHFLQATGSVGSIKQTVSLASSPQPLTAKGEVQINSNLTSNNV